MKIYARSRLIVDRAFPSIDRPDCAMLWPHPTSRSSTSDHVKSASHSALSAVMTTSDALQLIGGQLDHDVLTFSSSRNLSMRATTSSSERASALHPVMIGPS